MHSHFELRHSPLTRVVAIAAPTIEFMLFGSLIAYGHTPPETAAALAALLMLCSFLHSWFVLGSRYEVDASVLRIVHGPWRRTVPLTDLLAALPLRTLDRGPVVQVRMAYGRLLVLTPLDRTAFLDALEAHAPHIELHAVEVATRTRAAH
jgi:hypothetical protein